MKITQESIRERFKERGLKSTPQRTAIYKALAETTSHPTAEALYKNVARIHPMISPNTVYYTLAVLRDAGLVQEVNYWHDCARFDANVTPHHHLICLGCRSIVDLIDQRLNHLELPIGIPSNFELIGHQVEFRGYCRSCRRKPSKIRIHSRGGPQSLLKGGSHG